MVKSELIKKIHDNFPSLIKSDIIKMVDIITSEIIGALCCDEFSGVELRGYGRFSIKTQRARVGRNPRTGGQIQIDTKKKIRFKASSTLLKRLNEN